MDGKCYCTIILNDDERIMPDVRIDKKSEKELTEREERNILALEIQNWTESYNNRNAVRIGEINFLIKEKQKEIETLQAELEQLNG